MKAPETPPFDLTRAEARLLASLTPEWRIQEYLDTVLLYDTKGGACRSPRRVIRDLLCQCSFTDLPCAHKGHGGKLLHQ